MVVRPYEEVGMGLRSRILPVVKPEVSGNSDDADRVGMGRFHIYAVPTV